jgi:hypothetical protein
MKANAHQTPCGVKICPPKLVYDTRTSDCHTDANYKRVFTRFRCYKKHGREIDDIIRMHLPGWLVGQELKEEDSRTCKSMIIASYLCLAERYRRGGTGVAAPCISTPIQN